jgi:hypothetical protein
MPCSFANSTAAFSTFAPDSAALRLLATAWMRRAAAYARIGRVDAVDVEQIRKPAPSAAAMATAAAAAAAERRHLRR